MLKNKAQKILIDDYPVVGEQYSLLATVAFSWSCRRNNIYEFCQRQYFLHYYATANGWDVDNCSQFEREIYLLKNLQPLNYVIKEVFVRALKKELQTFCGKINFKKVVKSIDKSAKKELLRLLCNANDYRMVSKDPKRFGIFECFYCICSVNEIKHMALNELENLVKNFCSEKNYFFNELLLAKNGDVKFHKTPDDFILSNTRIWVAPDLIYESKGVLNCLNFRFGRHSLMNDFKLNNNVLMLYLMNNYASFRGKIVILNYYYQSKDLKVFSLDDFNGRYLTAKLENSIERLRKIANRNVLIESDFPKFDVDKSLSCERCNFKNYCNKN